MSTAKIIDLWEWLTEPPRSVTDKAVRRDMWLFAQLVLCFAVMAVVSAAAMLAFVKTSAIQQLIIFITVSISVASELTAYGLNRYGKQTLSVYVYAVGIQIAILI